MKSALIIAASVLSVTTIAAANPTTRPVSAPGETRVEQLIQQLGAEEFKTRAAAAAQLRNMGRSVLPVLKGRRGHDDPEIASWCAALVDQLDPKPRPDVARLSGQQITALHMINGRLVRVQVERPVVFERRIRADVERMVRLKDARLKQLAEVEAEIRDLKKQIGEPVHLRLVGPAQVEAAAEAPDPVAK